MIAAFLRSSQAFADADVQSARALAVLWQDDVGNLHAGLRATELNPGLRLVLAIFNRRLGEHIRMLFPDCTVLSGTAMSAPSFVAAALGELAPSHVRVRRRTLYVARPADVAPGAVICGPATPADDQASPRLLPPGDRPADLVLAVADGTPRNPLARRRNPARAAGGLLRGRHVLLIADVRAGPGLAGSFITDTGQDGQARVLALQAGGAAALDWSPHRGYLLAAGDRLIVLATRKGLGRFLSDVLPG